MKKDVETGVNKAGLPITDFGSRLHEKYKDVARYIQKNPTMSFIDFDYASGRDLILCTFLKSVDLISADKTVRDIQRALSFLIDIFNKPVIHLKDEEVVLALDAVKRVNHKTIEHLARHTENWKGIDRRGQEVLPKKLLTKINEDDYGIYENVVFCNLINKILLFLRKQIYFLSEILHTLNEIKLEGSGRFNHAMYYLAVGKLYLGFFKFDNSAEAREKLNTVTRLYRLINSHKQCDVYAKNLGVRPLAGEIKKTNLLAMHQNYKHVYTLYQAMEKRGAPGVPVAGTAALQAKSQAYYEKFCQTLTLFAAVNFNFKCGPGETVFRDGKADARFKNNKWALTVSSRYIGAADCNAVSLNMKRGRKAVDYLLLPTSYYIVADKQPYYEKIIGNMLSAEYAPYDKYVFLEPYYFENGAQSDYSIRFTAQGKSAHYAILPVSVSEMNSFRRIQKILFECMARCYGEFDICAFCGEALTADDGKNYVCNKCGTAVRRIDCESCKKPFTTTYFAKESGLPETDDGYLKYIPEFFKQEKRHLFRNAVKIKDGQFICPHCGGANANNLDEKEINFKKDNDYVKEIEN